MNWTDMRAELREMLCAHEAFRKMGFEPDDIFVGTGMDPKYGSEPQIFVVVVRKKVSFNLRVCTLWCDEQEMHDAWKDAVKLWNDPTHADLCTRFWEQSELRHRFVELAAAVRGKGISLPAADAVHMKGSN